jgi:hypothetical protein
MLLSLRVATAPPERSIAGWTSHRLRCVGSGNLPGGLHSVWKCLFSLGRCARGRGTVLTRREVASDVGVTRRVTWVPGNGASVNLGLVRAIAVGRIHSATRPEGHPAWIIQSGATVSGRW